jgi:hypothetical protein
MIKNTIGMRTWAGPEETVQKHNTYIPRRDRSAKPRTSKP